MCHNVNSGLNLLVVQDDQSGRAYLRGLLERASIAINDMVFVTSLEEGIKYLNDNTCDVILFNMDIHGCDRLSSLIKVIESYSDAAVVVIGEGDEQGLKAVTCGAEEYLIRGHYDADLLGKSIENAIEKKQIAEQIQSGKDQYLTLLDNLPQRILLKDTNSVIISCNEKYAQQLGMTPEDIIGKTDYDIYSKESADKYRASDVEVMQSRKRRDDFVTFLENGAEKIIHVIKTPVLNNKAELVGVLCIFEDVTKQKQAERSAKTAYEELKDTHEKLKTVQSQIIQSEKLAALGQLAAGVAHEINNPMGFVICNFETLQNYVGIFQDLLRKYDGFLRGVQPLMGKSAQDKFNDILATREQVNLDFILDDISSLFSETQEGLGRITHIVQNLRDFSRIDQKGERDLYDLNKGIESTLVVARNETKYVATIKKRLGDVPEVICNAGQINQVLLNIIINAAQAIKNETSKKKGSITIKTFAQDSEAVCEICDNGPGIPEETLTRIFDPFFTTKPPGQGTGLGLSVSYDIVVNKHGGKLLVESSVGIGTIFTIRLPLEHNLEQSDRQDDDLITKAF